MNAVPFELMVEFYEDVLENDPRSAIETLRGEDGEITLDYEGDPLIEKWERELAMGIDPDLTEGMNEESLNKLKKEREKALKSKQKSKDASINEDFSKQSGMFDPRFDSKYVVPGSAEDLVLRNQAALRHASDPSILGRGRRGR